MRQLSFSNFRRFEYFPPLTFGDITFLVGGNNCGKSTVVKALLLTFDNLRHIRNSWKESSSHAPKFRFDANQIHDLHVGTFWRALNHHAADRKDKTISFSLVVGQISFGITIEGNENDKDDSYETLSPIILLSINDTEGVSVTFDYKKSQATLFTKETNLTMAMERPTVLMNENDIINQIVDFSEKCNEYKYELQSLAQRVASTLRNNVIEYIYTHAAMQKIVFSYEDKNDYIAAVLHDYFEEQILEEGDERKFVIEWMKKFEIGTDFSIDCKSGAAYYVKIKNMAGREMELADLGLGYIQIMILLLKLATFISRYEGPSTPTPTIVIEEPEQNLHPKLQSLLADLFADIYNDYGFRFIIETHSEYIIRSVQNIVLQQSYQDQEELEQKNPFKVYYFPTTRTPYDMGFLPSGRFKNKFDTGFFDEAGRLHMTIIKHERRK